MAVPIQDVSELNEALGIPGQLGVDFRITPEILQMFHSDDASQGNTQQDAINRFIAARTLYQTVRDNGPGEAIFYKLHDKANLIAAYNRNRMAIRDQFTAQFGANQPTPLQKTTFFTNLRDTITAIPLPRTHDQELQLELATRWCTSPRLNVLASATQNATDWFETERAGVEALAENAFFEVDAAAAKAEGAVYDPQGHNWGTNVAWALSVARQQTPIRIISPLSLANTFRTSRVPPPPQPLPSAFALEISIAIMMGYNLNFAGNGVTMDPPVILPNSNTTGVLGIGILPTADEQLTIYEACVMASLRNDGTLANTIAPWSLATHKVWREWLTTPPLDDKAVFDGVRADLREIQLAAIVTDLNTKRTTGNGQNLRDEITRISAGVDNVDKTDLADALESMRVAGQLTPLLDTLTATEHNNLRTMFTNAPCQGAVAYDNLRTAAESARVNRLYADTLDNQRRNDIGTLRTTITDACNGNDNAKRDLANVLALMRRNDQLDPVLLGLTLAELGRLNTTLNNAPCQGVAAYDDLRTAATAALQASQQAVEVRARSDSNPVPPITNAFNNIRGRNRSSSLDSQENRNRNNLGM